MLKGLHQRCNGDCDYSFRSFRLIEGIAVTYGLIWFIYLPVVVRIKLSMAWQDGEAIRSLFRIRKKFRDIESPLTFNALRIPAFNSVSIASC